MVNYCINNKVLVPGDRAAVLLPRGPFVGYRYFTTAGIDVAFPFGYGLSYSRFEYSDLTVNQEGATLTVTNTSTRDGAEVVQLYVSAPGGVFGPARELKASPRWRFPPVNR